MKRIIVLSDGCRPTEDLYFWGSARGYLKSRAGFEINRIDCRKHSPLKKDLPKDACYLIFRSIAKEWVRFFAKNHYEKIFFLIDDHFQAAAESNELPELYRTKLAEIAAERLPIIKGLASKVIVTSEGLADSYSQFSPLRLNPSMLELTPQLADFSQREWKLGYHGTSSHVADLEAIYPAVINILKENPNTTFESLLGEHTPLPLKEQPGCFCIRPMPWSTYVQYRKYTRMHIGLAPLMDTPFNRGKSWVKFLDITASGGVGVYSNREPYTQVIEDGVNGLLAEDDPVHWEDCLRRLLQYRKDTKKMAKKAQNKALAVGHPKWSYRFWRKLLEY